MLISRRRGWARPVGAGFFAPWLRQVHYCSCVSFHVRLINLLRLELPEESGEFPHFLLRGVCWRWIDRKVPDQPPANWSQQLFHEAKLKSPVLFSVIFQVRGDV